MGNVIVTVLAGDSGPDLKYSVHNPAEDPKVRPALTLLAGALTIFFKDFIYLFETERYRERDSMSRGRGRGRGRSRRPTELGARHRTRSQDPEIMAGAEGGHLTD